MTLFGMKVPFEWEMVWWTLWYGLLCRWDWFWHRVRHPSHQMSWRSSPDPPVCDGDMNCTTCNTTFHCRGGEWSNAIGQFLCPYFGGHYTTEGSTGWQRSVGWDDAKDEPIYEPLPEAPQPYSCFRCSKLLPNGYTRGS